MDHHAFIAEMKEPVLPKPDLVILKGVSIIYYFLGADTGIGMVCT